MNGILVVNKPLGYTSRDLVNLVGGILHTKKIGHTGTLDPNATGVMVLCVGKALKVCELLTNHDKEYIAEVILGIETDTLDTDSNATILQDVNVNIKKEEIISTIRSFKKKYLQEVPLYSSVKVNGRKLYEYARTKTAVTLPKKEVEIFDIMLCSDIDYRDGKIYFSIKTTVSKGTYIRSLVRDIGNALGAPAVLNKLTRTKLGKFSIEDCYELDDIKNNNFKFVDITESLPDIPKIKVNYELATKVKNGAVLNKFFDDDMAFIIDMSDDLLAIYRNDENKTRPYKMFV